MSAALFAGYSNRSLGFNTLVTRGRSSLAPRKRYTLSIQQRILMPQGSSWAAPSYTSFLLNARPAGQPPQSGVEVCNMHAITPESEVSSHYF